MKPIIYILCLLLTASMVSAAVTLDQVKVYVNSVRQTEPDESGGDIDTTYNDVVDMMVTIENTENLTSQAKLKLTIQDINEGDDIVKDITWFDISSSDTKTKTLSFTIPSNAALDNYDAILRIDYKLNNGTEYFMKNVDYNVIVSKETVNEEFSLVQAFRNLTSTCNIISSGLGTCFGYIGSYQNCSDDLSTVKEERGTYKSNADTCAENLQVCKDERAAITNDKQNCLNEKAVMINTADCTSQCNVKVKDAEGKKDMTYMIILGVVGVLWYIQDKKKKTISPGGAMTYYRKEI